MQSSKAGDWPKLPDGLFWRVRRDHSDPSRVILRITNKREAIKDWSVYVGDIETEESFLVMLANEATHLWSEMERELSLDEWIANFNAVD